MDHKLREILATCIEEMESGASDLDGCLRRFPAQANALRPHLALYSALGSGHLVEPETHVVYRGQQMMLAGLAAGPGGPAGWGEGIPRYLTPAVVKVMAVLAGVLLLTGGAAGASAALGGPDLADGTLALVGAAGGDDGEGDDVVGPNSDDADDGGDVVGALGECEDANRGHGNDTDHDDEDNPGQGGGNHGADDDVEAPTPTPTPTPSADGTATPTPTAECEDADEDAATDDPCGDDSAPQEPVGSTDESAPAECPDETAEANTAEDGCEDANRGHGNDADHDDADNPGQGGGNHGAEESAASPDGSECPAAEATDATPDTAAEDANRGHGNDPDHDDADNPGQGQGNHGTGNDPNDNSNKNKDKTKD